MFELLVQRVIWIDHYMNTLFIVSQLTVQIHLHMLQPVYFPLPDDIKVTQMTKLKSSSLKVVNNFNVRQLPQFDSGILNIIFTFLSDKVSSERLEMLDPWIWDHSFGMHSTFWFLPRYVIAIFWTTSEAAIHLSFLLLVSMNRYLGLPYLWLIWPNKNHTNIL